ncbi:MAG TPA: PPK2 family polyphosphate kinase [Ktedonobacterales bacterium]
MANEKHKRVITGGKKINVNDYDPAETNGISRADAEAKLPDMTARLDRLQDLLYGAKTHGLLVVLQGMDAAGKDGTIRHVFQSFDPVGTNAYSFKAPTEEELDHDFLWRVHRYAPGRGYVSIFNRSHYEDVLIVRVHEMVQRDIWKARYQQINEFERMLTENNTLIIKFFLHISKDEQRQRFLDREHDPKAAWKLALSDWQERAYWDAYQEAYSEAISQCGTERAPWHIVSANHKWYRNYYVTQSLLDLLEPHGKKWEQALTARGKQALAEIAESGIHTEG